MKQVVVNRELAIIDDMSILHTGQYHQQRNAPIEKRKKQAVKEVFGLCNQLFPLDIDGDYLYSHPNLEHFRFVYGYESYNIRRTTFGVIKRYFLAGGRNYLDKIEVKAKHVANERIPKGLWST